jgi:hypothetical protein
MNAQELIFTARELVVDDKGLLAMDESNPTCNKRFARLGIPQTEDARRAYRELLVTDIVALVSRFLAISVTTNASSAPIQLVTISPMKTCRMTNILTTRARPTSPPSHWSRMEF